MPVTSPVKENTCSRRGTKVINQENQNYCHAYFLIIKN